jgi:type III pantothenate kinase
MKLLVDVGNTRIKWAIEDAATLSSITAFELRASNFTTQFFSALSTLPPAMPVLLASVVSSDLGALIATALNRHFTQVIRVGPPRSMPELQLAYRDPQMLGVDRWLGMLAAVGTPSLVVSCGSALTLDLIDDQGRHRGGLIAPSPERMREALLVRAPHLAVDGGRVVEFADNTMDAVASGAVLAAVALIERQAALAYRLLGEPVRVLITGGGRHALLPRLACAFEQREHLVFEGMQRWSRLAAASA